MSIYVSQSLSKPPQMIAGSGFEIGKCTPLYPISTDEDPGLRIESFDLTSMFSLSKRVVVSRGLQQSGRSWRRGTICF
jgi:hypothetical protein